MMQKHKSMSIDTPHSTHSHQKIKMISLISTKNNKPIYTNSVLNKLKHKEDRSPSIVTTIVAGGAASTIFSIRHLL